MDYTQISQVKLYLQVEIKDVTNNKAAVLTLKSTSSGTMTKISGFQDLDDINVLPCNNFMQSLFSQVNLILNGTNLSVSDSQYAYKSYLENLLSFSNEKKKTELLSELYYPDEAFKHADGNSHPYRVRAKFMKNGIIELLGPIHHEMSSTQKLLPSNVPISFQLFRSKPNNSLLVTGTLASGETDSEYEINIKVAKLYVRRLKIHPSVVLDIEENLKNTPALFPITRSEIKIFSMPSEFYQNHQINSIFLGCLPKRIFVFLVSISKLDNLRNSAFEFNHYSCNKVKLTSEVFPTPKILTCNFENKHFVEAYDALLDCLGASASSHNVGLTMDDFIGKTMKLEFLRAKMFALFFQGGSAVFAFDLTQDHQAYNSHISHPRSASLNIELSFDSQPRGPLKIFVYSEFNSIVTLE